VYVCALSAPEVARMHPYGHASDWWSLGILMFALLVGQVCIFSNILLHCVSCNMITLLQQCHVVLVAMVVVVISILSSLIR